MSDGKFTVPIDGKYSISASYFKPNGKYKSVTNDDRKWWQFWKPKTLMIQDGERVSSPVEVGAMRVGDE